MLEIGTRIGHYEILRSLDKGGMGRVYLVRHVTLESEYAMKVLNPEVAENEEYVTRFLREGRLASKIHHPNLITVHDAGQDPVTGLNYLIMDYVSGGTLADLLRREKTLEPQRALSIVRQVARALVAAADKGMVHRDIKPANIMFDKDGVVRLADLGIAKGGEDMTAVTCVASVFGTPAYMSPEQAVDSGRVDGRTDIYSLGVVLWQMLVGVRPYADKTAMGIVASLLSPTPIRDVRKLNPRAPVEVARLVADMCQKDVAKRVPSARVLLKRLDGLLGDDTAPETVVCAASDVTAVTVSPETRFRMGRLVASIAFAAGLLLAAAVTVSWVRRTERVASEIEVPAERTLPTAAAPASEPKVTVAPPAAARQQSVCDAAERLAQEQKRAEAERLAQEQKRAEAERLAQEQKRAAVERLAQEQKRAEAERLAQEQKRVEAARLAQEQKRAEEKRRLDEETLLAASAMGKVRSVTQTSETRDVPVEPKVCRPTTVEKDPATLALAAFAAGNWSLGYQYALQDTTGHAEVELWLGRCFDPAVRMPGFDRFKKNAAFAREHYRRAAEKGLEEARRALERL